MAYVDWMLKTIKIATCNCDYGCPCEFNAPPTRTSCEGAEAMKIEEGHFGDIRLDGLLVAGTYRWPGPVHEGKGVYQAIIDKRASEQQVDALFKILGGEEQEPTTVFNIYGSTIEEELDPIFADIAFEWDIERRTGRFAVAGVCDVSVEPIRNPVTGKPHRAVIGLPEGFEFREGEMASATLAGTGEIKFDHTGRYGVLSRVAYGPYGIID